MNYYFYYYYSLLFIFLLYIASSITIISVNYIIHDYLLLLYSITNILLYIIHYYLLLFYSITIPGAGNVEVSAGGLSMERLRALYDA